MAKPKRLVAEQWLEGISTTLGLMGYADTEQARGDGFSRIYASYPEQYADNFFIEATLATDWLRGGMQVYDFDKDFTKSIINENWARMLPDVLEYAPHKQFYLKLPFNETSEGTIVSVQPYRYLKAMDADTIFYRDIVETESGKITLLGSTELPEGQWMFAIVEQHGEKKWWIMRYAIPSKYGYMYDNTPLGEYPITLMLNALAYLCSVNADINTTYIPPTIKPNPKKDKKRSKATWHSVGYYIGSRLREYDRVVYEGGGDGSGHVRPHIRRAHWHHDWVDPRDNNRLELRWLEPTEVGFDNAELKPVLHRVG